MINSEIVFMIMNNQIEHIQMKMIIHIKNVMKDVKHVVNQVHMKK